MKNLFDYLYKCVVIALFFILIDKSFNERIPDWFQWLCFAIAALSSFIPAKKDKP